MKKFSFIIPVLSLFLTGLIASCGGGSNKEAQEHHIAVTPETRIVSLNGTVTEILYELGLGSNIVAVDVTSTYPESAQQLPKVGHNRNMSAERILAENPTLVIGMSEFMQPQLLEQLRGAGVTTIAYDFEHSIESGKELTRRLADTLGRSDKAETIVLAIDKDLAEVSKPAATPKVLFIYARGAGTMMVAGEQTAPNTMIRLAGGVNAVSGFSDFKPLTPEALVEANPDVILMFDDGLQSLGGLDGLLQVRGVAETNAGRNKQVIEMDGLLLTGFGPRSGKAVAELSKKLNEVPVN